MKKVLIIDNNPESSLELERFLKEGPIIEDVDGSVDCCIKCDIRPVGRYMPILVDTVDDGLEKIKESEGPKVVLLNVAFLDALKKIKREYRVIVIMIGASAETTREAMRLGALDVAPKTLNMEDIHWMLDRAFCRLYARDKIFSIVTEEASKDRSHLVGESKPMLELNKKIGGAYRETSPVLIAGETGTGKGLVARLIHEESERAAAPFIAIDCGAVPDELRESELFGYEGGAFTGAKSEGKLGRFELADGGTLFLDEVSNMTPALQATLLDVLQTQEIQRLGGTQIRKIDVRLIAATNQDLAQMVANGKFREDLFYRLKGYEIALAPLRERKEDIPLLVPHFLQHVQDKEDRSMPGISEKVMKLLEGYNWPGNVRELENCIKSAAVNSQGEVILPEDLPQEIRVGGRRHITEESVPEIRSLKTSETSIYENLFDLPVMVFCQLISGEENITEAQITNWSKRLSHYARRSVASARHEIHSWTQAWKNGLITSASLLTDIATVVKIADTRLSEVRYGADFKRTAKPISIEGRTLTGSLIAVLHEVVKEYGDDREKAARVLQMDPKKLDGWLDPEKNVERETYKKPSRTLKPFPDKEVESLLTKPIDYFVTEQFSRAEWRAKSQYEQIRTVHLALKSVVGRLVGDPGCIYFGGMTFEQIQKQVYRRAAYLYNDETEAAEALDVDVRTFRKHWSISESGKAFPEHYTLF